MAWAIAWFALSLVAGAIAGNKGRSGFGFFVLSILLSPLVGILAAFAASPDHEKIKKNTIEDGEGRTCPYCDEIIKPAAKVCKHCGRDVPSIKPGMEIDPDTGQKGGIVEWLKNN